MRQKHYAVRREGKERVKGERGERGERMVNEVRMKEAVVVLRDSGKGRKGLDF